jgi:hypothetical protein
MVLKQEIRRAEDSAATDSGGEADGLSAPYTLRAARLQPRRDAPGEGGEVLR